MKVAREVSVPVVSAEGAAHVVVDYEYDDERDAYTIQFSGGLLERGDVDSLAAVLHYIPQYHRAYASGFFA